MIWALFAILLGLFIASFLTLYHKFLKINTLAKRQELIISEQKAGNTADTTDSANFKLAEANLALLEKQEELQDQQGKLAEANLALLEKQEELQGQQGKLAEANLKLLEIKEKIELEIERSEKLLLNILPARVAQDLKQHGSSQPELFNNVTIFFSDIVNFTKQSEILTPQELISELSDIFAEFDKIFTSNNCERIKTIGDAYLSVAGMPDEDENHHINILNSAIQALQYLKKRNKHSKYKWEMRMGIHSGKVVGGIVGISKYIYDVFGDAINTAARMEKYSIPMRINVSEATFELAKDKFNFKRRFPRQVKGKGVLKMFFLEAPLCSKNPNTKRK